MSNSGKYSKLSQNAVLFAFSNFGSKVMSFLLIPLYTFILSTEDYGTVELLNSTVSLLIPVLTLNIQDAVLRFALDTEQSPQQVFSVAFRVNLIADMILGAILIGADVLHILELDTVYLFFLFIMFMFGALNNSLTMYFKATDNIVVMVKGGLLNTLLMCSLNLIFLMVLKWGVYGYLGAMILAQMISVIYMCVDGKVYKHVIISRNNKITLQMIEYSSPLILNTVSWWINNVSDRYILTFFCGVGANGIYSVAYKIPTILSTLQGVFYNAWSISAVKEFDENDSDGFIGNIYSAYSMISCLGCAAIMLCNEYISRILYANDFFTAWKFVPFLLAGTVFNGLSLFEGCLFTAVKKTKEVSHTTMIGAIVNTALNVVLIKYFGPIGAACATMIGYITTWGIRNIYLKGIISMKVNWKIQFSSYALIIIQAVAATCKNTELQLGAMSLLVFVQWKAIAIIIKTLIAKLKK